MNPLGSLPQSTSGPLRLNALDLKKMGRGLLVLLASFFLANVEPQIVGHSWVFGGVDYTMLAGVINWAVVEGLRRFIAGNGGTIPGSSENQ